MANRVTGLKIELEIDGSKVTKWLQSFKTEAGKAQSSLKDLEKSLKLNPTNADLIGQKFQVLREAIDKTEDYLDKLQKSFEKLRNKQDPTEKDVQAMRNLQREISDTTVKLRDLENAYKNMGSVGIQQLKAVGGQLQELGKSIQSQGAEIQQLGMEWERIGAPIQAAFGYAIKEGSDFEKGMSAVKAVTGATSEQFELLETAARDMARQTVFSAGEVAEAEYYMGLAGWKAQESVDGLAGVLDLAAAGQVDLGRASSIVVDGITALGYTAADSTHFVNVMAAAMSNSNTTVDLLGESFKYAAPLAGSLHYSVEDLTLGLGLMASAGIKGSQAGTGLRMAFKNMADESKIAAANAAGFNITMDDGYGNALPFRKVITQLRKEFGGLNLELIDEEGNLKTGEQLWEEYGDSLPTTQMDKFKAVTELVGVRALPGVLGMINASQDDFEELANAIDNADDSFVEMEGHIYPVTEAIELFGEEAVNADGRIVGVAEAMRNIQLDNLQGDLTLLRDNLADLGIEIYKTLGPYIRQFVGWIGQLAEKFRNLSPEAKKIITVIGLIVAAIGPALMVVGGIVRGVGTVISTIGMLISGVATFLGFISGTVMPLLSAFFSFLLANPIVLVIAGIIAIVVTLINHWDLVKEKAAEVVAWVQEKWEALKDALSEIWNSMIEFGTALWEGLKTVAIEVVTSLKDGVIKLWENIKEKAIELWTAVKNKVTEIVTAVKDKAIELWTALKNKIVEIFTAVKNKIVELWTTIKEKVIGFVTGVKDKVIELWNALKDKVVSIVTAVKDTLVNIWTNIKTTVTNLVEGLKNTVTNIWNTIKTTVSNVVNTIKSTLSNVWNAIKSTATNVWNGIKNAITNPIESAKNTIKGIIDKIKGFFPLSIGKIFSNFKLPHIEVNWKDIAGIVSIPTFSISWYAKAMKKGMLLDGATIFGQGANGQLLGGGEAGREWIVGENGLMSMIRGAVSQNQLTPEVIYNAVLTGMENADITVYMDGQKVTNVVSKRIGLNQSANMRYYGV